MAPDENKIWLTPFPTPMVESAFAWATELVNTGHTGGVIFAPTRTGKTSLTRLLCDELRDFVGRRGRRIVSATVRVEAFDRLVLSEGGFWHWLLNEVNHASVNKHGLTPMKGRHLVYEYFKGEAGSCPSGRLILIIDEAQKLELTELGWLADLFNAMHTDGFELIVLLVGSYHLQKWKEELKQKPHEHIRSRFFKKEHELTGLCSLEDFQRTLRRYDVDKRPLSGVCSIVEHFQSKWACAGGRLADHAATFIEGFRRYSQNPQEMNVPMEYFVGTVRNLLDRDDFSLSAETIESAVEYSGFASHIPI